MKTTRTIAKPSRDRDSSPTAPHQDMTTHHTRPLDANQVEVRNQEPEVLKLNKAKPRQGKTPPPPRKDLQVEDSEGDHRQCRIHQHCQEKSCPATARNPMPEETGEAATVHVQHPFPNKTSGCDWNSHRRNTLTRQRRPKTFPTCTLPCALPTPR